LRAKVLLFDAISADAPALCRAIDHLSVSRQLCNVTRRRMFRNMRTLDCRHGVVSASSDCEPSR